MSNHPLEQEEIMAYLDGELPPERAAEAASHLEHCPHCKQLAADLQEVSQMVMSWQVENSVLEPTGDLAQALEKPASRTAPAIHRRARLGLLDPRRWPRPLWGLAVAGLIAVVVLTPSLTRHSTSSFVSVKQELEPAPAPPKVPRAPVPSAIYRYSPANQLKSSADFSARQPGAGTAGKPGLEEQQDDSELGDQETSNVPGSNGPMIVRTAELQVTTREFDKARSSLDVILKRHHGYIGELSVNTAAGSARSLTGTLRVPASQLDATLADLKSLGKTETESQGGDEVTQQYTDLQARLVNARHTEQRLTDILRERTGKLSDVLAVEMQISRVRGEIEQMEAQRKTMKDQVEFATVTLTFAEEYKAQLKAVPPSTGTRFRNAAVQGYRSLVDGIIAVLLWLLSVGPSLLVWVAILFFPARILWKRVRPKFSGMFLKSRLP